MRHKVNIKGVIVPTDEAWIYELFEIDHTSAKTVSKEIEKADGGDLEVIINSGGGSVFDGSEIYTELKDHQGDVEVKIVGIAASAASVVAMAGDKVRMSPTAQMMIHNAATGNRGDYRSMDKASEMLKSVNKTIANAYRIKSGMEENDLLNLMDEETWMTPQSALAKKLIDEVMFEEPNIKFTASTTATNMIPQEVIDGVRNGLLKDKQPTASVTIDKETLDNALAELKSDILNEIKPNNEPPKPNPVENNWLF